MIRQTVYKAGDFDDHGLLKAPWLFWCGVLLQTRTWWLTGLGMATEQGRHWLSLIYPDMVWQLTGLSAGVAALAMLFCYPVRGSMPVLAKAAYLLMLGVLSVMLAGDISLLTETWPASAGTGWLILCPELACLVALWPDRRLRAVFFRRADGLA
ncbi:DUF2919 family protein [Salmonella enterica]|nr:DUF2919 domain-containing protein [Salmonella enterica subsp. enterica serovar Oranienburg]EEI9430725.1 DUF2919 domain-containing protein [Salmonella enterica subsp. diarizonae]ELE1937006.1 DUF2919 family protein [Salmonella enterica]MIP07478.1 DUF2919 family protein [Salmonella enterica subsp. enterica serovar Oranienburg]